MRRHDQVHMAVDQARQQVQTGNIDHAVLGRRTRRVHYGRDPFPIDRKRCIAETAAFHVENLPTYEPEHGPLLAWTER